MKITHICLSCVYIEGLGYQENILPKKHRDMGYDVDIIAKLENYNSKYVTTTEKYGFSYTNGIGVNVSLLDMKAKYIRFGFSGYFPKLSECLKQSKPDIIFVHGGQFVSLNTIVNYCKENKNVKLYLDQHGDYYNMPVDTWKRRVVHSIILGHGIRKAAKIPRKYWGVTPWRCEYLNDVYRVPKSKIDLLVMGGDDNKIDFTNKNWIRTEIRKSLNIEEEDFVIITGGKIDRAKNIHLLIQAVNELDLDKVKLIVFGKMDAEMELKVNVNSERIRYIGWISADEVYNYYLSSDLACFPGTHSVLWEQACASGLPGLFKDWDGMHHVDLGGNVIFLHEDSKEEMKNVINRLLTNKSQYDEMKRTAEEKCIKEFSYNRIARRAIEIEEDI